MNKQQFTLVFRNGTTSVHWDVDLKHAITWATHTFVSLSEVRMAS
jgi:hypothetical protein